LRNLNPQETSLEFLVDERLGGGPPKHRRFFWLAALTKLPARNAATGVDPRMRSMQEAGHRIAPPAFVEEWGAGGAYPGVLDLPKGG
jgi:hypothetical protein